MIGNFLKTDVSSFLGFVFGNKLFTFFGTKSGFLNFSNGLIFLGGGSISISGSMISGGILGFSFFFRLYPFFIESNLSMKKFSQ
ncbi:hypothetical protein NY2A_b186R [Paramecium bursaria Chlorella virus NY2A]|uniref:Uncharacterized protein b186R n=1 Tax=Paramecium bursaria Chlorella virus NY2A TaxID=46021 RepID=A7IW61_PBCVN|nr:hypothetical protein NY2A_b186R [Paramecium bursaria Chlorella virus NY2A]ABT14585.1 hypothetical protein NY2A_b186R [Paramecium bursaria Chlorella virus NY2A]